MNPIRYLRSDPRSRTMSAPPRNPQPEEAKTAETGDAGHDGYTVIERSSRPDGGYPTEGWDRPSFDIED